MHKAYKKTAFVLAGALIFYVLFCAALNYIIIPKAVIPRMNEYIKTNFSGPVSLSIEDISFNPVSGFMLKGLELSGPVKLREDYILRARLVDIDLSLFPLLLKKVAVKKFEIFDVDLNIGRDSSGEWNYRSLLELGMFKDVGDFDFIIKKFSIKRGWIDYMDCMKEGPSGTDGHILLEKMDCDMVITEKDITIEKITGLIQARPVFLSGRVILGRSKDIFLAGNIGRVNNNLHMVLSSENQGKLNWRAVLNKSHVNIHADISDLKNLAFNLNAEGDIDLQDLINMPDAAKSGIAGKGHILGNLKGEADKVSSLEGNASIEVSDFSILGWQPTSFNCAMVVKDGVASGDIPKTGFYDGTLSGTFKADPDKWGAELYVDKLELSKLLRADSKFEGIKGTFSGDAACVGRWENSKSAKGGGYFKLIDCQLESAPIISNAEEGIKSVTKGFSMPAFREVQGIFDIKDGGINIKNSFWKAAVMTLSVVGGLSFSGEADFTVGVKFQREGVFRTARQVLVPVTIGFDLIANCIQVKVYGKLPACSQKTEIQPDGWLDTFFPFKEKIDPDRYKLQDLWALR